METDTVFDILIVGAGFSGLYHLHNLRKRGFSVRVFETGTYMGGTWHWNRYPGARVDSEVPIYQFNDPAVWDFPWTERFPQHAELRQYFKYLDNKLDLSKDIQFKTHVSGAQFDDGRRQWEVTTKDGNQNTSVTWARHLILCTGSTTSKYVPPLKGLAKFKGDCYHSYNWPKTGVDFTGKRVAVVGTGATGVQIIQKLGPIVGHLTVYQRTPNHSLPSRNAFADYPGQEDLFPLKKDYAPIYDQARKTMSGFVYDYVNRNTLDDTPEERRKFYQSLYDYGSFAFWMGNYKDLLYNNEANDLAYEFWVEQTKARIHDPVKKELLAPLKKLHPFGTKRPCLETNYYEIYNQPNVDLINLRESPIVEITERGIVTTKEKELEFDIIVIATGFDSLTGSIKAIDIRNGAGKSLREEWLTNGTKTYMGISTPGYPNLWYSYGPQAPTPLGNGVTIIEMLGEWLVELMVRMREKGKTLVEAKEDAGVKWMKELRSSWEASLLPGADSWYQGANIPGKMREPLCYVGGYANWAAMLWKLADNNYNTFNVS